jgi:hypothetical protein
MQNFSSPFSSGDRVRIRIRGRYPLPYFYRGKEDGFLDLMHLAHQEFIFPVDHYAEGIIEDNIGVENEGFVRKIWGRKQRVLLHPFYFVVDWQGNFVILPSVLLSPLRRRLSRVGTVLRRFLNQFV